MKNREIKFRAWHKEEKVLCKVETLTNDGAFLIGAKKGKDEIQDRIIVYAPDDGRFCRNEEIELMQFTGLQDKKGKDIYEGDILKGGNGHKRTVVFERGCFMWCDHPLTFDENVEIEEMFGLFPTEWAEVIGNIHENAGLLAVAP